MSESHSVVSDCDPMDHIVHGILQARILEWVVFLFSRRSSQRSNQSILKEISAEYSLEGLMVKLKLQYFGYLM